MTQQRIFIVLFYFTCNICNYCSKNVRHSSIGTSDNQSLPNTSTG